MATDGYPFTCVKCGFMEHRSGTAKAEPCPTCGEKQFRVLVELVDRLELRDELDAVGTNREGEMTLERLTRTDGNIEASLASDRGKPATLSATRKERVDGFEEEETAAQALAKAFNTRHGTRYAVQPKKKDDYDYPDRILGSSGDEPKLVIVQIRHLDTDVIAKLGKADKFDVNRTSGDLIASIIKAIAVKAKVDPKVKPKTLLLLQIPAPLGKLVRKEIQRWSFDLKGFKGVWIAPFREESFEVFGPLQHHDLAEEAYRLWEQEKHLWGRDQEHWYTAIDNLRRL